MLKNDLSSSPQSLSKVKYLVLDESYMTSCFEQSLLKQIDCVVKEGLFKSFNHIRSLSSATLPDSVEELARSKELYDELKCENIKF